MERCVHCNGKDAALYESGLLICLKCVALQEAKATKDHPASVHDVLVRDLTEATLSAESAATEFSAVTSDLPSFIPPPDGAQRIRNVSHQLTEARNAMAKAHHRLNDYLEHGIVPEDLKRNGSI